ncbi:hypothetical protein CRYUN_Cryun26dG0078100 [Craigia yunnanensis]
MSFSLKSLNHYYSNNKRSIIMLISGFSGLTAYAGFFEVALLKEKLGFDDAFNHKEETDLKSTLERIAVCGVISEYTDAEKRAAPIMIDVIYKIKIQGFLAGDYLNMFADFFSTTCDHLHTGKIQPLEDISNGIENIPLAFISLFWGRNIGKKIVKIAEE